MRAAIAPLNHNFRQSDQAQAAVFCRQSMGAKLSVLGLTYSEQHYLGSKVFRVCATEGLRCAEFEMRY
jgi:hypothetical protein